MIIPDYALSCFAAIGFKNIESMAMGQSGQIELSLTTIQNIKIPLPPIDIQEKIVAEIEALEEKELRAKGEIEHFQNGISKTIDSIYNTTDIFLTLDKVCSIKRGRFTHRPRNEPKFFGGSYPFIQTGDIVRANGKRVNYVQTLNEEGLIVSKLFQPTIVLVTIAANIGDTAILDYPACFTDSVVGLIPFENVNVYFLEFMMRKQKKSLEENAPQTAQKNINIQILSKVKIPLPSLEIQQQIVSQITAIEAQIAALEKELETIPQQKEAILKKYL